MSALLLSTWIGCWEGNIPNGGTDSGSTGSDCRLGYLEAGSVDDVRVVDFTVDGLPTIVTPTEYCHSLDGGQADISLDVSGTGAVVSVSGTPGSSTALPGTGVVVQIQYGAQVWSRDDFYLGEVRVDPTSGALFGEASGDAGQITIDVAWGE